MTMSFTATFGADALARPETSTSVGLFGRIQQARIRRAQRAVRSYLSRFSDEHLAGLGYGPGEIAKIRASAADPQLVLL